MEELKSNELREISGGGIIPILIGMVIFGYKAEAMNQGNKWYEFPPLPE